MNNRKSYLSIILDYFMFKVNEYSFSRLQSSGNFDAEEAYWKIKEYDYETLGEYARTTFIS